MDKCPYCSDFCSICSPELILDVRTSESILASHPIYQKIGKQIDKGLKKYNEPVTPEHYSVMGWLQHMQEEMVDGLTYANALEERLKQAKEIIEIMYKRILYDEDIQIKFYIEQLKQILGD